MMLDHGSSVQGDDDAGASVDIGIAGLAQRSQHLAGASRRDLVGSLDLGPQILCDGGPKPDQAKAAACERARVDDTGGVC